MRSPRPTSRPRTEIFKKTDLPRRQEFFAEKGWSTPRLYLLRTITRQHLELSGERGRTTFRPWLLSIITPRCLEFFGEGGTLSDHISSAPSNLDASRLWRETVEHFQAMMMVVVLLLLKISSVCAGEEPQPHVLSHCRLLKQARGKLRQGTKRVADGHACTIIHTNTRRVDTRREDTSIDSDKCDLGFCCSLGSDDKTLGVCCRSILGIARSTGRCSHVENISPRISYLRRRAFRQLERFLRI